MLTVHHLENSRSQRVVWLLEELGLPYEIVVHQRPASRQEVSPTLARIHPLGKAPVLADGDVVVAETGAIVEYLMERHGGAALQPAPGTPERVQYTYWRHFSEGSFMPYLAMKLVFAGLVQQAPWPLRPVPWLISRAVGALYLNPNILAEMRFIESHLGQNTWFAGEAFSAADVLIGFPMEAVAGRMAPAAQFPNIAAFVRRIRARPAYVRAMQKGGWSDADHAAYWAVLKP